jgi:hypothetical protein
MPLRRERRLLGILVARAKASEIPCVYRPAEYL